MQHRLATNPSRAVAPVGALSRRASKFDARARCAAARCSAARFRAAWSGLQRTGCSQGRWISTCNLARGHDCGVKRREPRFRRGKADRRSVYQRSRRNYRKDNKRAALRPKRSPDSETPIKAASPEGSGPETGEPQATIHGFRLQTRIEPEPSERDKLRSKPADPTKLVSNTVSEQTVCVSFTDLIELRYFRFYQICKPVSSGRPGAARKHTPQACGG